MGKQLNFFFLIITYCAFGQGVPWDGQWNMKTTTSGGHWEVVYNIKIFPVHDGAPSKMVPARISRVSVNCETC